MTHSRSDLFTAIRPFAKDGRLTNDMVPAIDALADMMGLAREGDMALVPALRLIKEFEGLSLKAYPDPATNGDPWTIGFGATGPGIVKGVVWTQVQADTRLASDVAKFMAGVNALVTSGSANQIGAMTSLAYNVGLGNFKASTLLRKHNARDYAGAALEFGKWNKANGKIMAGLTRRRAAECAVYSS